MALDFSIILSSVKDLIKYQSVRLINTGDKNIDNILNTLVISIITLMFAKELWEKIYDRCLIILDKLKYGSSTINETKITEDNYIRFAKIFELNHRQNKYNSASWIWSDNSTFTSQFLDYVATLHIIRINDNHRSIRPDLSSAPALTMTSISSLFAKWNAIYITERHKIVGLYVRGSSTDPLVCYETEDDLKEFIAFLRNRKPKKATSLQILYTVKNDPYYSSLYPDYTFSRYVSRHKPKLINALTNFSNSSKGKPSLNGFGSYNLGIMLHGKPGTGKTLLIKTICNFLKRNAYMINMRNVKTSTDFSNLFSADKLNSYVYVLDEFDCVMGVIKQRNELKIDTNVCRQEKERLKNEYFKLLTFQVQHNDNKEVNDNIENLKKELQTLENTLSLDSILTELDGVIERRGRIIIASTNHIEHIDEALLRPGRFDLKLHLTEFNREEIIELLTLIYPNDKHLKYLQNIQLRENEFTPIEIINMCRCSTDLAEVIDKLKITAKVD